jgi:hypothetical protein
MIHISELDILASDWKKDSDLVYSDELQERQAEKYRFIAETYKRMKSSSGHNPSLLSQFLGRVDRPGPDKEHRPSNRTTGRRPNHSSPGVDVRCR